MSTLPSLLLIPSQEIVRVCVGEKGLIFCIMRNCTDQYQEGKRTDGRLRHQNERKEMGMGTNERIMLRKQTGSFCHISWLRAMDGAIQHHDLREV